MIAVLNLRGRFEQLRVADEALADLVDRRGRVDDLVRGDAGDRGAEDDAGHVAAGLGGVAGRRPRAGARSPGTSSTSDPVQLDVLPVGDVGGVAGEVAGDLADDAQLLGGQRAAVDADAEHEVLVLELVRLERGGLAAVDARACAGCRGPTSGSGRAGRSGSIESNPRLA